MTDWTKWIVDLCKIHSRKYQCDIYAAETARDAVMIQNGCSKCTILIPLGEEPVEIWK